MSSKQEKINNFNPNDIANAENNIFGLPFSEKESEIIILPMPWDVTVSYGSGAAEGPGAIYNASMQVDLYDPAVRDAWKIGIFMQEVEPRMIEKSVELRSLVEIYLEKLEEGYSFTEDGELKSIGEKVNEESLKFKNLVKQKALQILNNNKLLVGLGGDHSTPLGIIEALSEKYESFGILQLDAHADLRDAYEGFEFSHASIMFNALKIKNVSKLVQAGIRDYSESEIDIIKNSGGRIHTFFDRDIKRARLQGRTFEQTAQEIINALPEYVYLSFDIDALDPKLCPHTGTPVPGGFEFDEVIFLVEQLVRSGKKLIAFDLNEVAPGIESEWDANVGARLLYKLCNLLAVSHGKASFSS